MDEQSVREMVVTAVERLFASQPGLFKLTPESAQTEWNLTHYLARELSTLLPKFAYDVDIKKPEAGGGRPDIMFHQRGTHEDNFLVIEVKRDNPKSLEGEMEKIRQYWFAEPRS